jgi:hypothetical protein
MKKRNVKLPAQGNKEISLQAVVMSCVVNAFKA